MGLGRFVQGWAAGMAVGLAVGSALSGYAASYLAPAANVEENGFYSGNEFRDLGYCQYAYVSGVFDAVRMLGEATLWPRSTYVRSAADEVSLLLPPDALAQWRAVNRSRFAAAFGREEPATTLYDLWINLEDAPDEGTETLRVAVGLAAALAVYWEFSVARDAFTKLPSGVTNAQLTDVVRRYIEEHPTERHLSAAWLVWKATAEGFFP